MPSACSASTYRITWTNRLSILPKNIPLLRLARNRRIKRQPFSLLTTKRNYRSSCSRIRKKECRSYKPKRIFKSLAAKRTARWKPPSKETSISQKCNQKSIVDWNSKSRLPRVSLSGLKSSKRRRNMHFTT